jgi:hypothetical protein
MLVTETFMQSSACRTLVVLATLVITSPVEARIDEMYRMERRRHHASAQLTTSDLEKAIIEAAKRSGWWARVREPGVIEAEKSVRAGKHRAVVEIFYDDNTFLVKYLRSYNLNHNPDKCRASNKRRQKYCREVIHPHYNVWVKTLEDDIAREISWTDPAREDAEAATPAPETTDPSVFVADEILKLKKLEEAGILTPEEFEAQKMKLLGN